MVQRGGAVRSKVMPTVNGANLKQAIRDNVAICSEVHTDMNQGYAGLEPKFTHKTVKHMAGEYSRHEGENVVTTASVESYFSLLKRGVIGTFHHVSPNIRAAQQHRPTECSFPVVPLGRTPCQNHFALDVWGKRI